MTTINPQDILDELKLTRVPSMELEEKCFMIISTRTLDSPSDRLRRRLRHERRGGPQARRELLQAPVAAADQKHRQAQRPDPQGAAHRPQHQKVQNREDAPLDPRHHGHSPEHQRPPNRALRVPDQLVQAREQELPALQDRDPPRAAAVRKGGRRSRRPGTEKPSP